MLRIVLPGLLLALTMPALAQTILIPDTNLRLWLNYAKPNSVDANGYCDTTAWNAQPPSGVGFSLYGLPDNITVNLEGIQYLKMPMLSIGDIGESNITLLWPGHPRDNGVLSVSTILVEDIVGPFLPLPDTLVSFSCNACGLVDLPMFNGQELEVRNVDLSGQVLAVSPFFERLTLQNCNLSTMPDFANVQYLTISGNPLAGWPAFPPGLLALYASTVGLSDMPPVPASLLSLQLGYNNITDLPSIPAQLTSLYLEHNELTSLPPLPPDLWRLEVPYNPITVLPALPNSVFELDASYTDITSLPAPLPSGLYELNVEGSDLGALPPLLGDLHILEISNTPITELPPLPANMTRLNAENTAQLVCLPPLPSTLYQLTLEGSGVSCLPNIPTGINLGTLGIPAVVCDITDPCPQSIPLITGTTFHDANTNGVFDGGEAPRPFSTVVAQPGDLLAGSDQNGDYVLPADIGDFTVTGVEPLYAPVSTAPYTVTFTAPGEVDSLNHIGFAVIPGVYDLVTEVVANAVRPGFNTQLWITVRNVGTEPTIAQVQLTFDLALSWVGSTIAPGTLNGNVAEWTTAALAPGEAWTARVTLYAPPVLPLGTPVVQQATATPAQVDETPADNSFVLNDVVVGSYDSNDKRVQPATLALEEVASGTSVHYTVRFQNTGTYPAERVMITDTLSNDLQRTSVQLTGSSHSCIWYLHHGVLHVLFAGINLPDSTSDEAGSHGFVSFNFTPVSTLLPGATVANVANIHFDYNAPIITNAAVFAVETSTGLANGSGEGVRLWPNPVTSTLHVQTDEAFTGAVEVLDATGRVVLREPAMGTHQVLPVASLADGVYTLRCTTARDVCSTRFVKH